MMKRSCSIFLIMLVLASVNAVAGPLPDRAEVARYAAREGERVWRAAQNPDRYKPLSRDLFTYALALCEAGQHPERLQILFATASKMQDHDPASRGYGNFKWSWEHAKVLDFNAVEFSMQSATALWIRQRDKLPPAAREQLQSIITLAVQGCLRHKVKPNYTNIALMNASNLILLGEMNGDAAVAAEGYTRLDAAEQSIRQFGIHEYCSPTYYGTDLEDLTMLEAFCQSERGRAQARALLELFWTDIAANWFPGAQKLAGTRSRDYDYLRGLGHLDTQMWLNGWLEGEPIGGFESIIPALARWSPPERLRQLNQTRLPRLVRQSWGETPSAFRTHYLLPGVTLSASGESYGGQMDLPLTADLAGPRESVRGYFIADGRHDPYGKNKIPDKSNAHQKVFHLTPFFAGAQCRRDALGLAVYRPADLNAQTQSLESHFVLPLAVDGFWINDRKIAIDNKKSFAIPLHPGEALTLRKGSAAIGVRLAWARDCAGRPADATFSYDGNPYGAARLTVDHHYSPGAEIGKTAPGAAFWVRIDEGLSDDAAFARWRGEFAAAALKVGASAKLISVRAAGLDGPVAVGAAAPFKKANQMEPPPAKVVLELDGRDVGKEILDQGLKAK